jgi:hypothetical protein
MKNLAILSCIAISFASVHAAPAPSTSKEYNEAYKCAMEAFASGYTAGPAGYCVGNSRDPSSIEQKAYKTAEIAFRKKANPAPTGANSCPFAYGTYIANGSHADNFEEGPQRIANMKQIARMMTGREISLFDKNNQPIPRETASLWFKKKTPYEWVLTPEALKSCSKKQIG